jgi:membrane fusion protein, macrolide-specific efflux system
VKRWLSRRPSLVLNVALGVLALAAAFVSYRTVAAPVSAPATANTRYAVVSTGPVVANASAAGTVQSASTANADFATAGTVTEIGVRVGDLVAKGQVLAKVDPAAIQDQLDTANANLSSANQALARARAAVPADQATIATAQAQVIQAQATVAAQQRALDGTVLKAPIAGTVTAVNGSVGASSSGASSSTAGTGSSGRGTTGSTAAPATATDSSASGSGFIQLADLTRMQVSGYFAEADATRLAVDQPATVSWNALANARATGKVASISPTATTQNNVNSYQVLVSLDALPTGVRIGQTTTIAVTVGRADNVLRVPSAAVRSAGGRYTVQLVSATNQTRTVQVQVGLRGDTFDEVTDGLAEGDRVVLAQQTGTGTGGNFPGGGGFFPGGGAGGPGGGAGNRGGAGRGGG